MNVKNLKLAVVIVCTNEKHYLQECIDSLNNQSFSGFKIFLIDNHSIDGSVEFVSDRYPDIEIVKNKDNLGFATANNIGMRFAFKKGFEACVLINPDTKSDKNMILNLVNTYFSKKNKGDKIGLIQPLLLLYDKPDLINSSGNPIHFLGFGYAGNYLRSKDIVKSDKELLSATGGAALITKNFFYETGGFDETFFMYCEDQNMCWQGLLFGYKHFLSCKAILYHKYRFSKNKKKMFYAERNRLMMFFENYSFKTILLLSPILILNELLMFFYSLSNGWINYKLMSYFSFMRNIKIVLQKRKIVQSKRIIKDNEIFNKMTCCLDFSGITNSFFRPINFLYCLYFNIVKFFI